MYLRFIGLVLVILLSAAKPPDLSPRDTKIKIQEILRAHVNYHELTHELIGRAFQNYLEELDPGKMYLLESEVDPWTNPSEELLEATLKNMRQENFTNFENLHAIIVPAIVRRNVIEKETELADLPKDVQVSDFKEIEWAKTSEELEQRILSIRSLQLDAAEKFEEEIKGQFKERMAKRRTKREEELQPTTSKMRTQLVLSLVLKSMSCALDSQTTYFTPSEANQFMIQVQQRLFGIGAQLRDDLNGFTIVRLLEGGPAKEENNLKVNDRIIAVDKEPVVGMEITEAVELIRGPRGSKVLLTVLREKDEKLDIEITRNEVVLTETRIDSSFEPFGDGVIAIIHLYSFYGDSKTSSTTDVHKAIQEIKNKHNLKGIIFDLRDNAGGLLPQAVSVTGLFIERGVVVSVKDNSGEVQHLRNLDEKLAWDGPLLVLTSRTSASAAEIVAQTLQEYGRAVVVGDETTYGKGTFQTFTLESANYGKINPKGEYKVTRGRYYTVSGKSPQLVGVHPDIVVPGLFSELEIGEKYSKFPLENESIPPSFDDKLEDVPLMHRAQFNRLYKESFQTILDTYAPYMETLKSNSATRIEQNKNYQNFIKEIANKDTLSETAENYGLSDLQLHEASNIMKDLILLMQEEQQGDSAA